MDSRQRLAALGLMRGVVKNNSEQRGSMTSTSSELNYEMTKFGRTLLNILNPEAVEKWTL